nr:neuromedin-U receptor 2-like [Biomphalaria glabrata]
MLEMELQAVEMIDNALRLNETLGKIDTLIDSEDEYTRTINTARWVINLILTPILCILGVVGNILNIIVLRQCGFKDTNVLLLESLSLADLFLSLVHSILHAHFIVECFDLVLAALVGTFSFVYLFGAYQITLCVVQCHLVSIAAERVIAVYFPFHVARIFSRSRVLIIIACMYLFCFVLNFPGYFIFEPGLMHLAALNQTIYTIAPTKFFLDNYDTLGNFTNLGVGIFNAGVLPITIIIGSALVGIKLLIRKRQSFPKVKKSDANDLKGLRLLMAVCVVSVLFTISGLVMIHYYNVYRIMYGPFHELLLDITNLICQFFSSTNFVIYVTMSNKFYRTYRMLICRF